MAKGTYYHWLLEVEASPGVGDEPAAPVRRWWSGKDDLTFGGVRWEGTVSDDDHGSLVNISSLQETADSPDTRLRIQLLQ